MDAARATPAAAIALQGAGVAVLILVLQSFPSALDFTTFAVLLAMMADVAALYALRRRAPERARPYRAWGYPWVPGVYLLATFGIAVGMLAGVPREALIAVFVLLAGLPFYVLFLARGASEGAS